MSMELGLNALQLSKNINGTTVHAYKVIYDKKDENKNPTQLIRSVASAIGKPNNYPLVTNLGPDLIVTLAPLDDLIVDTPWLVACLELHGQLELDANIPLHNGAMQRLVNQDLAKAAYLLAFNKGGTIEYLNQAGTVAIREKSPSERVRFKATFLDVFKTIELDPQVLPDGTVIIGLQLAHGLIAKSGISLQWVIDHRPNWLEVIKRVRHRYQSADRGKIVAEFDSVQTELNGSSILPSLGKSLYEYHATKGEIKGDLLEETKTSTVVKVKYSSKNVCDHAACLLEPVFDFESLSNIDPDTLNRLARDLKWSMEERIREGFKLIDGLVLPNFSSRLVKLEADVLQQLRLDISHIQLQFNRGQSNSERDVLRFGAYAQMTRDMIVPVVVGETADMGLAQKVFNDVFNTLSRINPSQLPNIAPSYPMQICDADELETRLQKKCPDNAILLIGLAPGADKRAIRDVAFSNKLATQFFKLDHKPNVYQQSSYAGNIAAGLFSKGGGQICKISNMPGNSELFIGLDMAGTTVRTPGFAFLFTHEGAQLGWQLADKQIGEKMSDAELTDLLTQAAKAYKKEMGEQPKRMTLHRDGKFYETLEVVESFELATGIKVDVLEVLKSGAPAIYRRTSLYDPDKKIIQKCFTNPEAGDAFVINENEIIISTYSGAELGKMDSFMSVRSLRLRKRHGETDLKTLAEQVLYLSRIHGASLYRHPRLPVTTHHADRFSKLRKEVRVESLAQMDRLCPVYL